MGRRTLLLITSVLLAAVGTAIVALYVRQADSRATQNEAVGTYVVARHDIEQGDKITRGDLNTVRLRARDQLATTVTDLDSAISRRATAKILAGTAIDERELTEAGAEIEDGAIQKGELGINVQLEDPERAAGLLGAGSWVRIFTMQGKTMKPLVGEARVITIGGTVVAAGGDGPDGKNPVGSSGVPAALVGLSVPPEVAQKLIDAQVKQVPMYFTVIPSVDVTDG